MRAFTFASIFALAFDLAVGVFYHPETNGVAEAGYACDNIFYSKETITNILGGTCSEIRALVAMNSYRRSRIKWYDPSSESSPYYDRRKIEREILFMNMILKNNPSDPLDLRHGQLSIPSYFLDFSEGVNYVAELILVDDAFVIMNQSCQFIGIISKRTSKDPQGGRVESKYHQCSRLVGFSPRLQNLDKWSQKNVGSSQSNKATKGSQKRKKKPGRRVKSLAEESQEKEWDDGSDNFDYLNLPDEII